MKTEDKLYKEAQIKRSITMSLEFFGLNKKQVVNVKKYILGLLKVPKLSSK